MKNRKENVKSKKGITLIALVVTIVVLLILAGITISTLFGENGIISAARRAEQETAKDENTTNQGMQGLQDQMNNLLGLGKWADNKNGSFSRNGVTIKIGDYVNYESVADLSDEKHSYTSYSGLNSNGNNHGSFNGVYEQTFIASDYSGNWRVLGVNDEGNLMIISDECVPLKLNGSYTKGFHMFGKLVWLCGIDELNNICSIYSDGIYGTNARCINIEDINYITGYDPMYEGINTNTTEITNNTPKNPYGKGTYNEYGSKSLFYWDGTANPYFIMDNGYKNKLTRHNYRTFWWYDGTEWRTGSSPASLTEQVTKVEDMNVITDDVNSNVIAEITNSGYVYYPTTLTSNSKDANNGISSTSSAYDLLFADSYSDEGMYWLASSYVRNEIDDVYYRFFSIRYGAIGGDIMFWKMYNSVDSSEGVRPVVNLALDVELSGSGENLGSINNMYKLSK